MWLTQVRQASVGEGDGDLAHRRILQFARAPLAITPERNPMRRNPRRAKLGLAGSTRPRFCGVLSATPQGRCRRRDQVSTLDVLLAAKLIMLGLTLKKS
jgi:hypothetical protein